MAAVLCWWGVNEQEVAPRGTPKGCAWPLCNTSSQRRTEIGNHLPSLPEPWRMLEMLGTRKCLGMAQSLPRGSVSCRHSDKRKLHQRDSSCCQTQRHWLFPPGKGVGSSSTGRRAWSASWHRLCFHSKGQSPGFVPHTQVWGPQYFSSPARVHTVWDAPLNHVVNPCLQYWK